MCTLQAFMGLSNMTGAAEEEEMRKNQEWFPLKSFPPSFQKEALTTVTKEEVRLTKGRLMMEEEERPAVTLCVSADHDSILKPREKGAVTRIAPHPLHTHPCAPLFLLFFFSPVLSVNQWQQEEEQSFVSVLTPTFFSPF